MAPAPLLSNEWICLSRVAGLVKPCHNLTVSPPPAEISRKASPPPITHQATETGA